MSPVWAERLITGHRVTIMEASGHADEPETESVTTRPDIEIVPDAEPDERLVRARRIRERSQELIDTLGIDHPLVTAALEKADALERQATSPDEIHLR